MSVIRLLFVSSALIALAKSAGVSPGAPPSSAIVDPGCSFLRQSRHTQVGGKCLGLLGAQTLKKVVPGPEGPMAVAKLPGVPLNTSLGMLGLTTGFTAWWVR